jgi:thioester reductase-like protein
MSYVFFTGFPGFLGTALLPRVLARLPDAGAVCLVQPSWAALARQRAAELEAEEPAMRGRLELVEGDITLPDLGLRPADADAFRRDVVEIFHLAAVYDLSVKRDLAVRVNVEGTRNMLDFAAACPRLRRFQYVSTCYVSGRHAGRFGEEELEKGQSFNNFYEETKYLAEALVRSRMAEGLPATIYRPAVVVGDSMTGETQKYDGPYFVLQWLLRQPRIAFMPVVGRAGAHVFNMVPRDFVVGAIAHLSGRPESLGRTYQLADPHPLTVAALLDEMARATRRTLVRVPLPLGVAKWSIDRVPGVYRLLRIPSSAVDYFVHPTLYDTRQASADLAGSGVACPPVPRYLPALVAFMERHAEIGAAAMA